MKAIGKKLWVIAEGYIPEYGTGKEPEFLSHETACILNTSDKPAQVSITIFFNDREPAGPFKITVEPRRTLHLRFNDLKEPEQVPLGTDYASVIESDTPIVVQHTRLDSRQAENAIMTTIAYSE
ncbi:sensory rhodopsin transducer [Chryseosolibacter indicus]|uniref:Sensory rhodopsin transducer n=1 Tax=Chryseosolibacter indicus TaxID=2782351 RepID=A0ABS5VM72_9BACT|nr:sensory rhodopsin transducer [Chryseosolibacter indicus]MBT1701930.1 sensory rhodopsin transducer [Chryseosolibacter indicus]